MYWILEEAREGGEGSAWEDCPGNAMWILLEPRKSGTENLISYTVLEQ